jgi:hypothetical protein
MKSNRAVRLARTAVRELGGVGLPALVAAGLFVLLPAESRSEGDTKQGGTGPVEAKVCGEWHRGAGETSALDLVAVKRSYAALKAQVERSLDRLKDEVREPDLARPFDAGLPACRGDETRSVVLDPAKGLRLRGKIFYFLAAGDPSRVTLPPELEKNTAAEVVVVRVRSLKDLPEVARSVGRPVSLAGRDFAQALGVRCASTWLKISEKGDAVEIHELR